MTIETQQETGMITWDNGTLVLRWDNCEIDNRAWSEPFNASSDSDAIAGAFGYDAESHADNVVFVSRPIRTVASELARLPDKRRRLLREFYYSVAITLPQLAEELEFADLDLPANSPGPLLDQHNIVCEMMELFAKIELGKTL